MSQPIDVAYVEVRPDVDNFAASLSRRLTAALNKVQANVDRSMRQTADRVTAEGGRAGDGFGNEFTRRASRSVDRLKGIVSGAVSGLGALGKATGGLVGITAAVGTGAAAIAGLASAASAAIPVVIGLATALATAAGALVAVPGAVAAVAAVIGTLKLGTQGLGEAFKAVAEGDSAAFNEALKKLAPNAQALARQVQALKPAFDGLRLQVQNALFADTDKVVAALAKNTLPTLRAGMVGLATAINGQVVAALTALNTRANQTNLGAVFTAARDIVASFGPALQPVTQALLDVVRVGAQVTAVFVTGLGAEIGAFAQRISAMAASGELAQMFRDGLSAAGQFLQLAQDILGIFGGIASAAGSGGGGLFAFFDQLNAAINSVAGQEALTELFANLATVGQALTPVLLAVAQALGPVSAAVGTLAVAFAPTLTTLVQALGGALTSLLPGFLALMPLIDTLASGLQPLAAILVDLVVGAAPGLNAFLTGLVGALQALAPAAGPVGQALGAVASALAPLLPMIGAQLANVLTIAATVLSGLASQLGPLIGLFGTLAADAAGKLLPVFLQLAAQVLPLMAQAGLDIAAAFTPLAPVIAQIASVVAGQLAAALPGLVASFAQLLPIVVQVAQQLGQTLLSALTEILPHLPQMVALGLQLAQSFADLFVAIYPLLPSLIQMGLLLVQASLSSGLLQGVIRSFTIALTLFAAQVQFVTSVVSALMSPMDLLRSVAGLVGSALSGLAGVIASVFSAARTVAVNAASATVNGVVGQFGQLAGRVGGAIAGMVGRVASVFSSVRGTATSATSGIVNAVVGSFGQLTGRVGSAISGLAGRVAGVLRGVAGSARSAGADIIRSIISGVNGLVGWAIGQARSAVHSIVQGIKDALPGSPVKEGPLTVLNRGYAGRQIVKMLIGGIEAAAPDARTALADVLTGARLVPQTGLSSTSQPAATSATSATSEALNVASRPGSDTGSESPIVVHVYVGDRELTEIIDVRVERNSRAQARRLAATPRTP